MQQGEMITFKYRGLLVVGMYEHIENETLWTRFSIIKQVSGWAPGRNVGYYLSDADEIKTTRYDAFKKELDTTFEQAGLWFDGENMIEIPNYAIGDYILFRKSTDHLLHVGIVDNIRKNGISLCCQFCINTRELFLQPIFISFKEFHKVTKDQQLITDLNQALLEQKSLVFDKDKKILRKWRAAQDESFYYISPDGDVRIKKENGDGFCNKCYEYGNYYKFSNIAIIVAKKIQRYL